MNSKFKPVLFYGEVDSGLWFDDCIFYISYSRKTSQTRSVPDLVLFGFFLSLTDQQVHRRPVLRLLHLFGLRGFR